MTGYQSKKAAAQDKMAHMTFEQRCRVSEQCLPDAPYRVMLTKLHNEMLAALVQRPWVGLTDEQISDIAINNPPMVHEFARAIEAKLKERNT
jgi:hypothetical protein